MNRRIKWQITPQQPNAGSGNPASTCRKGNKSPAFWATLQSKTTCKHFKLFNCDSQTYLKSHTHDKILVMWVWCVRTKKLPQLSKTSCSVRLISNKQLSVLLGNGGNWNTIIFSLITGTYHIAQQDPISVSMTLMIINANLFGQNWTSCKDLIHSLIPSFQDTFQKQSKVLLSLQTLERHI